jgi:hypothetical protein
MSKIKIIFFISLLGFNCGAANFDLNDLSVLFPLPLTENANLLPGGDTMGAKGELLPLDYIQRVPQLLKIASNEQVYPFLKVMGVRIDPCFMEGLAVMRCRHQIRMVWQPLSEDDETLNTYDASVHTFYDLTSTEFNELIEGLKNLKTLYPSRPQGLGVNPILNSEGLNGDYYKKFMALILKYAGHDNFSRITFMLLGQDGNQWTFGGFDTNHDVFKNIAIPRISAEAQVFRNSIKPDPIKFNGGILPEPVGDDLINFLVKDSEKVDLSQEQQIRDSVSAAFKIENPRLHNTGTMDCVSCHVAQAARVWTLVKFSNWDLMTENEDFIYKANFDLTNLSPLQSKTNVMRAFGYFLQNPVVSQRTINETAEAVKTVNENY